MKKKGKAGRAVTSFLAKTTEPEPQSIPSQTANNGDVNAASLIQFL